MTPKLPFADPRVTTARFRKHFTPSNRSSATQKMFEGCVFVLCGLPLTLDKQIKQLVAEHGGKHSTLVQKGLVRALRLYVLCKVVDYCTAGVYVRVRVRECHTPIHLLLSPTLWLFLISPFLLLSDNTPCDHLGSRDTQFIQSRCSEKVAICAHCCSLFCHCVRAGTKAVARV